MLNMDQLNEQSRRAADIRKKELKDGLAWLQSEHPDKVKLITLTSLAVREIEEAYVVVDLNGEM